MLIDSHAHIFLKTHPMGSNRRYTPDYDASIAQYTDMLRAFGGTHGVLVQPSFLGTDNSYLLEALQLFPHRFRGVVTVPPDATRRELEALNSKGVVGARLNLIELPGPDFKSALWRGHLDLLASLGWQLEVHMEAQRLEGVIAACRAAQVTLVVDHFGRPDEKLGIGDPGFQALLEASGRGAIFVKLSAPYRLGPGKRGCEIAAGAAPLLLQAFGPKRLLWGSDWPRTEFESSLPQPRGALAKLEQWLPNAAIRRQVLSTTPGYLYGFEIPALTQ